MKEEIWKPVKDFEEKYAISSWGRLKNIQTNNILKMTNQYSNYLSVVLYSGKKRKSTRIHRLVASAFIPNPENKPQVNHKDGNKQNNCVDNLEWCTRNENAIHAVKHNLGILNGVNKYNKNKCNNKYGYIYQLSKEGKIIEKYYSAKIASEKTGVCARNILQCINHQEGRKQAGGFIWLKESEVVK